MLNITRQTESGGKLHYYIGKRQESLVNIWITDYKSQSRQSRLSGLMIYSTIKRIFAVGVKPNIKYFLKRIDIDIDIVPQLLQ